MGQIEHAQDYNWLEIQGMDPNQAEIYMLENWNSIPNEWLDPIFRQKITGTPSDIEANISNGVQSYFDRLGPDSEGIIYSRNIQGQGHPNLKK